MAEGSGVEKAGEGKGGTSGDGRRQYTDDEFYKALKKSEILIHIATWTKLENITQSERRQPQRTKYWMISLT